MGAGHGVDSVDSQFQNIWSEHKTLTINAFGTEYMRKVSRSLSSFTRQTSLATVGVLGESTSPVEHARRHELVSCVEAVGR